MGLDNDLHEVYLPGGSATPRFEDIYNTIIQTDTEHSVQLYLDPPVILDDDYDEDISADDEDWKGLMKGPAIRRPVRRAAL